jgi:hypothetical protein
MAQVQLVPIESSVCRLERYLQCRNLGEEADVLYFAATYGLFEQICRTKSREAAELFKHKLDSVIAAYPDQRPALDWLKGSVDGALSRRIEQSEFDTLLAGADFRLILTNLMRSLLLIENADNDRVVELVNSEAALTRENYEVLASISNILNIEICIYWIASFDEYTRTETYSPRPGLTVDIYQIQMEGRVNTGLLYHEEHVKADSGQLVDLTKFPFTCLAGQTPGALTNCNSQEFQARYSNPNKTKPVSSDNKPPVPKLAPGPLSGSSYPSAPQPGSSYPAEPRSDSSNPSISKPGSNYPIGPQSVSQPGLINPFAPKPRYNPRIAPLIEEIFTIVNERTTENCDICSCATPRRMIYRDNICPANCKVCVVCMYEGLQRCRECPNCKNRTLSQLEIDLISGYWECLE